MSTNLTVPTVMMGGVVAIGLFAAYRLFKKNAEEVKPEGGTGELALLGDPLALTTNRYYRARIRVRDTGLPPFVNTSDRETIANAMKLLGFNDVQIFMNEAELPSGWPTSSKANAGPLTRWFQGQWQQASVSLPRPPDIEQMWISTPPVGATFKVSGVERFQRFPQGVG